MPGTHFWKDKKVFITGGGSGLGKALSKKLQSLEAQTLTLARTRGTADLVGDISDKNQTHRIFAEAFTKLGGMDVLINNASSLGPSELRLLLDTECEDFELALQTNLLGPFRLTKLVVPHMLLQGFGLVVNITSDASINAYPKWGAYGISKAALDHFTKILSAELNNTGVQVIALDPGDMDTPLHLAANPTVDRSTLFSPESSAELIVEQIAAHYFNPIRRSIR